MIYLLEDDDSIRKLVVYALKSQGYEAEGFDRPSAFWDAMEKTKPELILLDLMLPEEDGIAVLGKLRRHSATVDLPVILLTARGSEYDRVVGLDAGADDYVVKPFGMMELVARVRAVLRRSDRGSGEGEEETEYRVGPLWISPVRHEAAVNGAIVPLTYKEFALLTLLTRYAGRALDRAFLMDRVWGLGNEPENRTLDVHIRSLRLKLGEAGALIETVRGVGYRLKGELE